MTEELAWLEQFVNGLRSNRTLMVLAFCWCLGFALKKWRRFPNDLIPPLVIVLGAAFNVVIDNHHTPDLALWQERVVNFVIGFILGTLAWASHRLIWKNLGRIPVVGKYLDTGNSNPTAFVKGKNAEVEDIKDDHTD